MSEPYLHISISRELKNKTLSEKNEVENLFAVSDFICVKSYAVGKPIWYMFYECECSHNLVHIKFLSDSKLWDSKLKMV